MLLTITYTGRPALELGYLLHKNPFRPQSVDLSFGKAHVFYPEAKEESCTAALLLDINPVDLARGLRDASDEPLFTYVNDRPYVASSFLSVAIAKVFGTALTGRSKERPELANRQLPLTARISVMPAHGGEEMIRRLFEPLGYRIEVRGYPLDDEFPAWGESHLYTVTLSAQCRLADLLNHIYVLIPVLDVKKHYWIGEDEIEKLLRHGAGWLASHPAKELITNRYLKRRRNLVNKALNRLLSDEEPFSDEEGTGSLEAVESEPDREMNLNEQRLGTVVSVLKNLGAKRVIDLGCGEGKLLHVLLHDRSFTQVAGMDVSYRVLEKAHGRLRLDRLPPAQKERIKLFQGSLTYTDKRFQNYDAVTVTEVIEHLDVNRLGALERVLFEFTHPPAVVLTTPNREYNIKYANMSGELRHGDHRFEWTREEFKAWAQNVAGRYGYQVGFLGIGEEDSNLGAPTQMGVFTR